MTRIILLLTAALFTRALAAQAVFIPDPQFRAKLNAWAPGLVDGSGFLADNNWGMHPPELDLHVDWTPADLTGIEAIDGGINITISCDPGIMLTCDSMGIHDQITLVDYPNPALPSIGSASTLTIHRAPAISALPDLAIPNLTSVILNDLNSLTSAPVLPTGLVGVALHGYPLSAPMPVLPDGLVFFECRVSDHASIPEFPLVGFEGLAIDSMPFLQAVPTIPSGGLTSVSIENSGILTFDNVPLAAVYLTLRDNPDLVTVNSGVGTDEVIIYNCPSLTSVTLGDVFNGIEVSYAPSLTSLSIGSAQRLVLNGVDNLATLPPLPAELWTLTIGPSLVSELPPLPDGLQELVYSQGPLTALDTLPASLQYIYLELCPALAALPALPEGLTSLQLNVLPIDCLPHLPDGLQTFMCDNTNVTCMPNHPAAVPQFFPLCTILNSACPEHVPYVSGTVYRDDNVNGVHDPGEPALPFATITESPLGYMTGTDSLGRYVLGLPIGDHTLTVDPGVPYVLSTAPAQYDVTLTTPMDVMEGLDFAVEVDTVVPDLSVWTGVEPLRPGFNSIAIVQCANTGTTVYNVQVTMEAEPWLDNLNIYYPPGVVNGSTLTWTIDSLAIGELFTAGAFVHVPTSIPLGTPATTIATVLPFAEDVDTLNNVMARVDTVKGSYDPNDKRVTPSQITIAEGEDGRTVEYIIRFQNTGTFYAERVLVTDTLSADLDPSTFDLIASSHACTWFFRDGAVHFLFDPIFLPDSTSDEPGSHGFVAFEIETRPGLLPGATVPNEANIYFDFNAPVITEPCELEVELPAAVAVTDQQVGLAYPVPTHGLLTLAQGDVWLGAYYSLISATGALVQRGQVVSARPTIDLSKMPPGMYMLRLEAAGRSASQRVIKE